jgi:hypothetical protein
MELKTSERMASPQGSFEPKFILQAMPRLTSSEKPDVIWARAGRYGLNCHW